jgi:hypothetical protein
MPKDLFDQFMDAFERALNSAAEEVVEDLMQGAGVRPRDVPPPAKKKPMTKKGKSQAFKDRASGQSESFREKVRQSQAESAKQSQSNPHYAVLGVDPNADIEAIRGAYKALARKWHPDTNKSTKAPEMMRKLNEAMEWIERARK